MMPKRLICILLCLCSPLCADQQTETPISVVIPALRSLDLNRVHMTFPNADEAAFKRGYLEVNDVVKVKVTSNGPWTLSVHADNATLGRFGQRDKPIGDLQWKTAQGTTFVPLSETNSVIMTSQQPKKNTNIQIDMRLLLQWDLDGPGEYATTLTFTLGAPLG